MPKLNERKPDARRETLSIPVTAEFMGRLKRLAELRGVKLAALSRDMVEKGVEAAECLLLE